MPECGKATARQVVAKVVAEVERGVAQQTRAAGERRPEPGFARQAADIVEGGVREEMPRRVGSLLTSGVLVIALLSWPTTACRRSPARPTPSPDCSPSL